ncbi:non-ribosomal peptide synthetase [Actinophytocola algeriensis]|uniref:Amino acid adenylation domain-containing protein n=1 Tax=Actinophytocola algeriensis TaxID=1768010 RepID=A0A7W7Q338_9PSEU|nr:non-ribosomal peptide synthetase [Actinophytocola algeriensis]MBB4906170.1 amino acid adenylation domain-containing protein [Actinophytocola algeriensis]MBE1472145.1 amino acid adenylation domain-containing protein [Actinophytocola algeriensis]
MNARDLLERLEDAGVTVTLTGDRIHYRGAGTAPPPDLLAEMKSHRAELVSFLTRRRNLTWPPARDGAARRGPLTMAQRGLWATDFFAEDGTYNLGGALRLRGPLDDAALDGALTDLHRRHPSLRTVFTAGQGESRQHVLPAVPDRLTRRELPGLDACLRECARLADRKLPLDGMPPVAMTLFRTGPDDHVFFVVLHHVLADGVSVAVLLDDLARCYDTRLDGGRAAPPAHDLDMVDYARWEDDQLRYADLGAARRYWRDRLRGAAFGALPLPPPGPDDDERGGAVTATVDEATTAAVRAFAAGTRSSAFLVVTAAIGVALSRLTGRDDLVLGMPVARRDREGLAGLVGLLLDTVPVRLDVTGGATFAELVTRTRTAVLGAVAHPYVPAAGDPAERARFSVVVADAGTALPAPAFRGLDVTELRVPHAGAKFDLNVLVRDDGGILAVDVEFDRRATGAQSVTALLDLVRAILTAGTAPGARPVHELAAAPAAVAAEGAVGVAADRVPRADESVGRRFAAVAAARAGATAVSCAGTELSYEDLAARVGLLATGLRDRGIGLGDTVAVALPRGTDLVVAIVGVMAAGAACVVLDDSWPPARVDAVLADSGARLTITEDNLAGLVGADVGPVAPVPGHATAYVIYTSGSTGRPKGVHVTHHNLLSLLDATAGPFGFGHDDTWSLFHACSFDVSMYELFCCLLHGGRLVVVPEWTRREPDAFAALLARERVTVLSQTPSALAVMLPAIAARDGAADHLRYLLFAGEKLDRHLADQWYAAVGGPARLVNLYGTTETTVHASWRWLRPDETDTAESAIGGPLPGTALHVVDPAGAPVLDRCVGELWVGGPQVSTGYVGRPRETATRFVPDPFGAAPGARVYRTGDLARRTGTGLSYLGRRDAQVQVNGFRVELSEIEEALTAQPGVAAAAAAAQRDGSGSGIVAVVVPGEGATLSTADLVRGVRTVLPRYMVPRAVAVVDALPLTNNGKLDRAAVTATSAPDGHAPAVAPRDAREGLLAELFREVLAASSAVSADADFFDLGGDSMRAIRLVGLARERGLWLTVRDVYAAPVLSALATRAVLGEEDVTGSRAPFSLLPAELARTFPADVEDAYPMTAMQSGMIYHQELAPASRVYHIVLSYRVRGPMDPDAFRAAAQAVTDAHPVLRTSFDLAHPNGPTQRVHTGVEAVVDFEELDHLAPADQESRIRQVAAAETAHDFDLERAPLHRLVVLTLSADEYQLIFTHHHAILDGWSVNVFFEDLHTHYLELRAGGTGAVPRPRTRFADYVAAEQRALADPADREFWRARTASPARLVAPDRPQAPAMRQLSVELPGRIDGLRAVATRLDVPLKALLLAAHVRVISWLTGTDEVTTSLVYACRPEARDSERLLGLFLNQLPLRVDLTDQTWADLARQVYGDELAMMGHRWYPNAAIQRDFGTRPMFDSSFNFTDYHTTREMLRDGDVALVDSDELESTHYAFGSNYTVDLRTGELRVILEYDENALTPSTVALAAEAHRRVLTAFDQDANTPYRATALPGVADVTRPAEPALATRDVAQPHGHTAPGGALEQAVHDVWAEVLGADDYDVHTDFFAAGGDSLAAMQVVSRLRARHGALSMGAFIEAGTIAAVAAAINPSRGAGRSTVDTTGERRYPLSRAQSQMWLVANHLPGVALFGMPGALRIDGPLDLGVLATTFAALIRRHEALRTRVETTGDGPVQVVEPRATLDLATVDVSGETDPAARCEALMAAAVREPIPLDTAPLMRATVYRLGAELHVLYLNIHHLVCDGWSLTLLLTEAAATYRVRAAGGKPDVRPALGNGQLAQARAEWARGVEGQRELAHWVERLSPPWPTLDAPPGSRFVRAQGTTLLARLRSASCGRVLGAADTAALRAAARGRGLTEFTVVLSAFAATLRAWSGQDDVRIATQLANRATPGAEDVVGLVANTVVLRLRVGADDDPVAVTEQARAVGVDALAHQEIPFEDVLAELEARHPGDRGAPVFEVMLVVQEETRQVDVGEGLRFSPHRADRDVLGAPVAATTCDLVLGVTPVDGELALTLLYKPATVTRELAVALLDDVAAALVATTRALGENS